MTTSTPPDLSALAPTIKLIYNATDAPAIEAAVNAGGALALQAEIKVLVDKGEELEGQVNSAEAKLSAVLMEMEELKETQQTELRQREIFFEGRESALRTTIREGGFGGGGEKNPFAEITIIPFDGNPSKLEAFIANVDLRIFSTPKWFPDEMSKLRFYFAHLQGKARDQISAYYEPDTGNVNLANLAALKTILQSAFGEADQEGVAQAKVYSLKQGNKPLNEFLPEWQNAAARSGFNSKSLIYTLKSNIHIVLRRRLELSPSESTDWYKFVDEVRAADVTERRLDANYFKSSQPANNNTSGRPHVPHHNTAPAATSLHNDPMDTSRLDISKLDISTIGWSLKDKGRKPKNDEEKRAKALFCMATGRCNWCYALDHLGKMCPWAIWNKAEAWYRGGEKKKDDKGDSGNAST